MATTMKHSRTNSKSKRLSLPSINIRNGFLKQVVDVVKNKDIMRKIAVTLVIVALFRFLASIPLPGLDMGVYQEVFGSASASEANYLLLVFTGGQLDSPSIVGLGLAAFINASIIIQLLTPVIPKLTDLSKEGERGRQVLNQYTRYLTLPLSLLYSTAYIMLISRRDLNSSDSFTVSANPKYLISHAAGSDWPSVQKIIFMAIILAAGTLLLMWLSEIISENGIGNGSSIIITVGILAALPTLLRQDFALIGWKDFANEILSGNFSALGDSTFLAIVSIIIGAIILITALVFINESTREVDIQYARRVRVGDNTMKSNLPMKLTMTGVMPIIFASALLSVPQLIVPFLKNAVDTGSQFYRFLTSVENSFLFSTADNTLDNDDIYYSILYFVLIVLFGMFYAFIVMKPDETAENLQKSGAFIPGIRPGKSTETHISNILLRISFAGSIVLALLALLPIITRGIVLNSSGVNLAILSGIGGTSVLIAVSVVLDIVRQFNSLKATKSYDKYIYS